MKHTKAYDNNKAAKVGETINCLVCNKTFIKKQYSQVFCCGECKDKYWNRKGDRHKAGYYEKYDKKHPERLERAAIWGVKPGRFLNAEDEREILARLEYRKNEEFRNYVDESSLESGGWEEHGCYVTLADLLDNFCGYGEE